MSAGIAGYGDLWVGLSDAGKEGVWRFLDGSKYDPSTEQQPAWGWGVVANRDIYNCAYVYAPSGVRMTDQACDYPLYGLCEIITQSC